MPFSTYVCDKEQDDMGTVSSINCKISPFLNTVQFQVSTEGYSLMAMVTKRGPPHLLPSFSILIKRSKAKNILLT